ncbi:bifunctional phosphoribosylaminoimidazolecarboxamide formyltransferase/IMP cyclohydrolase [Bavariicoccus seileri]|uniref:bifunctional phosphoribosylaminoimidazolecarboxamide formyltransferase/IMP cyclohydrolase n=1 Tax=Bavariicoccus seileri TaxID=549685 RepID=UPI003F916E5E
MTRYALISVSDKSGIEEVAKALVEKDIKILSTGGTFRLLSSKGIPVDPVESITHFPEMMDGRVKTLHPMIHGGLLSVRNNPDHQQALIDHQIPVIDFVVVNLYPFKETIQKEDCRFEDAIETIDIGGPSMLRSAAKNAESVTVVTDPRDYDTMIAQLKQSGETSESFRRYLARKVFALTAYYDSLISKYLSEQAPEDADFKVYDWDHITLSYDWQQTLRYGENSHQSAEFYREIAGPQFSIANGIQLHGKELSYNNIRDADAAIKISREFSQPCAVAVKHMNPCGIAVGETIEKAFDLCYAADSISIFGGIIVLNRPVSLALAEKLHHIFLELIIAPSFEEKAYDLLAHKKNLRLITLDFDKRSDSYEDEYVSVIGGMLKQSPDQSHELANEAIDTLPVEWKVMTETVPTAEEIAALNFAMKACKHVKSNAIVISNGKMTLGIGAGQMNRVGSAAIALQEAKEKIEQLGETTEPFVMASDAFFPMDDTVQLAHEYGIKAIVQPGGSIKDKDSVDKCNQFGIAMVKTGIRHFKH